jgi:hypothetical protein
MNFYISEIPFSNYIENEIIINLKKNFPDFFFRISKYEILYIQKKIKKKFNIFISSNIIKSIKSLYTKNYIIKNTSKIYSLIDNILIDYNNNVDILTISSLYKISPLHLLRLVFFKKYNIKISFPPNQKLNNFDIIQLFKAIKYDYYAPLNDNHVLKLSMQFEYKIEKILIKNNIKYKTQETLTKEQIKEYGRPINTPDFLIMSKVYINNIKINWIDAKNFYGANINFIKKKIIEQQTRYYNFYGSGCIIFNLGFNELLSNNNNILYISYKHFKKL